MFPSTRIIYQKRRDGRQCFGGGNHNVGLARKIHSVRRELFDESGIEFNNAAILYVSHPQYVETRYDNEICLVQIILLDEQQIHIVQQEKQKFNISGVINVGGVEMCCREVSRRQKTPDWYAYSDEGHNRNYIMGITNSIRHIDFDSWDAPLFRQCDLDTILTLRHIIISMTNCYDKLKKPLNMHDECSNSNVLGGHWCSNRKEILNNLKRLTDLWQHHANQTTISGWPTIPDCVLYDTLQNSNYLNQYIFTKRQNWFWFRRIDSLD
jgi:hypothetical protein